NLKESNEKILDLLDKIKLVEIKELDLESYQRVLTFKQRSQKKIEPRLVHIKVKGGIIGKEELEEIREIIIDLHNTVS
ncbi:hypothetical protein J4G37_45940, partial [Microvirga sp. 3-52]|nr:hypothetical protein [Microvirga sp. 3-52]